MTVGERIRQRRKALKLTMKDITTMTGITSGNLSEIENDKYLPSVPTLIHLSKALKCSIDWIITGECRISESLISEQKHEIDNMSPLSEQEKKIIWMYQQLNSQDKTYVNDTVEMLYNKALKKGTLSGSMTGGTGEEAAASETA